MMKAIAYMLLVLTLTAESVATEEHNESSGWPPDSLETAEEALKAALKYVFGDGPEHLAAEAPERLAARTYMQGSSIPTLADSMDGRAIWLVQLESVRLGQSEVFQNVDICLDIQKRVLLEIRVKRSDIQLPPSAQAALRNYTSRDRRQEVFCGLPEEYPVTSLDEALASISFCPMCGECMIAQYVLHTESFSIPRDETIRAVWSITWLDWQPDINTDSEDWKGVKHIGRAIIDASSGTAVLNDLWFPPDR